MNRDEISILPIKSKTLDFALMSKINCLIQVFFNNLSIKGTKKSIISKRMI